jgi:hypothetical protein
MIQNAARECGVTVPNTVIGNTDENVVRLVSWANVEGRKLRARTRWPALRVEATFTSLAAELQGTLASIVTSSYTFDHIIPDTMFNRSTQQKIVGITPKDYQALKASSAAGPFPNFYIRGASLYLYPTPTAGHTYAFEFVDKSFCQSSGGTRQTKWTADTDTGLLDEDLMELGVIWRWKKSNGLDYGEDFNTYEEEVGLAVSRVDPAETISLTPRQPYGPYGTIIVPEANWNL